MADDDQISDAVAGVVETMRTSDDFKRVVSSFQLAGPPGQFARQLHADLCSAAREMRRKCRAKQIDIGRDELEAARTTCSVAVCRPVAELRRHQRVGAPRVGR